MDLNLIKKPVITEKSTTNAQINKYVFEVRNDANKKTVKETIEETYKVKIEKLNSLNVKSKPKVFKVTIILFNSDLEPRWPLKTLGLLLTFKLLSFSIFTL
jgi:ribosomal protein L23